MWFPLQMGIENWYYQHSNEPFRFLNEYKSKLRLTTFIFRIKSKLQATHSSFSLPPKSSQETSPRTALHTIPICMRSRRSAPSASSSLESVPLKLVCLTTLAVLTTKFASYLPTLITAIVFIQDAERDY